MAHVDVVHFPSGSNSWDGCTVLEIIPSPRSHGDTASRQCGNYTDGLILSPLDFARANARVCSVFCFRNWNKSESHFEWGTVRQDHVLYLISPLQECSLQMGLPNTLWLTGHLLWHGRNQHQRNQIKGMKSWGWGCRDENKQANKEKMHEKCI